MSLCRETYLFRSFISRCKSGRSVFSHSLPRCATTCAKSGKGHRWNIFRASFWFSVWRSREKTNVALYEGSNFKFRRVGVRSFHKRRSWLGSPYSDYFRDAIQSALWGVFTTVRSILDTNLEINPVNFDEFWTNAGRFCVVFTRIFNIYLLFEAIFESFLPQKGKIITVCKESKSCVKHPCSALNIVEQTWDILEWRPAQLLTTLWPGICQQLFDLIGHKDDSCTKAYLRFGMNFVAKVRPIGHFTLKIVKKSRHNFTKETERRVFALKFEIDFRVKFWNILSRQNLKYVFSSSFEVDFHVKVWNIFFAQNLK